MPIKPEDLLKLTDDDRAVVKVIEERIEADLRREWDQGKMVITYIPSGDRLYARLKKSIVRREVEKIFREAGWVVAIEDQNAATQIKVWQPEPPSSHHGEKCTCPKC